MADGPEIVELDDKGNVIDVDFDGSSSKGRGRLADTAEDTVVYSFELKEECRDAGIEEYAIREGGDYRQFKRQGVFWLPLPELLAFEKKDAVTESDDEFWDWFGDLIKEKQLQTKSERTHKQSRSWKDWLPNYSGGWSSGKNHASQWWSDWGYSSYSGSSEMTKKLAIALRAINATVQVVNDTGKKYRVQLAADSSEAPMSFTAYNEKLIVVSPQALLDTSINQDTGIEVTTGYGLHEASHVKYSEPLKEALTEPSKLMPLTVSSLLHNILEDVRIEALTGEKFPGFVVYLERALKYLWDATSDKKPTTWGPDLQAKLNAAVAMVKWPDEFKPIADADPGLAAEFPWWREWIESYLEEKEPIRMSIIRALDHLKEDPETKKEMDKLSKDEEKAGAGASETLTDEQFKDLLDALRKAFLSGVGDPCPSPTQPGAEKVIKLTEQQGNELSKLMREQYQEEDSQFKMKIGGGREVGPKLQITRPEETQYSKAKYKKPGAMVERLRSVFFFRKKTPIERERLLKQGFVDEDELWRAGAGDIRVFERQSIAEESPTSVTLLVDISGSMSGTKVRRAMELANVMNACLRTQRGVRVRVRAHTTEYDGAGETCAIFRIWEPGDPDSRIGLLDALPKGSNFDGFAIEWCARELVKTAAADETMVLIVLSDGLPAGHTGSLYYGGPEAMKHMRWVGDSFKRDGVFTIQIAIDPNGLRPEDQAIMFENWIGYESDQKLLTDMTKLLSRIFGAVE